MPIASDLELAKLDSISHNYEHLGSPTEMAVRRAAMNVIRGFAPKEPSILELGCSDGYMTSLIAAVAGRHEVVEAAASFIDLARSQVPAKTVFHQGLFEDFQTDTRYDVVVMSFILEHVEQPADLIRRARGWLTPEGRIFAIVPNIRALSRQLGRVLGIVGSLDEITPSELAHGHRRSYDRVAFDRDIESGGAVILQRGGLVLKPFANFQLDAAYRAGAITDEQFRGLELLGCEYPDLCHALYAVAR